MASLFKLCNVVENIVVRGNVYSKEIWKKRVWTRAWELEDMFWNVPFRVHRSLDLVSRVSNSSQYLTRWKLFDKYPTMMHISEALSKLTCHTSLLKSEDVQLKKLPRSSRLCCQWDFSERENANHLIMQCLAFQTDRNLMCTEIRSLQGGYGVMFLDNSPWANSEIGLIFGVLRAERWRKVSWYQIKEQHPPFNFLLVGSLISCTLSVYRGLKMCVSKMADFQNIGN